MTSGQKIELSHEIRMWIVGVAVPLIATAGLIVTNPMFQDWFREQRMRIAAKRAAKKAAKNHGA